MSDQSRASVVKELTDKIPVITFLFLVVGGGAVALQRVSDLTAKQEVLVGEQKLFTASMLTKLETINTTLSNLLQIERRVVELERGLRENTIGDVEQSKEADRLRSAQALDHYALGNAEKLQQAVADQISRLTDQTNGRLPKGNGR